MLLQITSTSASSRLSMHNGCQVSLTQTSMNPLSILSANTKRVSPSVHPSLGLSSGEKKTSNINNQFGKKIYIPEHSTAVPACKLLQ